MGRIEADIALESWLFGFRPCSGQGQFTPAPCHELQAPFTVMSPRLLIPCQRIPRLLTATQCDVTAALLSQSVM